MRFIRRRVITGTCYFDSIGAAVNYYWTMNPGYKFKDMLQIIDIKIREGEIIIACPLPVQSGYYSLSVAEGRYYFLEDPQPIPENVTF